LPAIKNDVSFDNEFSGTPTERELFYKIVIDLKKEVNDLKKFVLSMANNPMLSANRDEFIPTIAEDFSRNSFSQKNEIDLPTFANPMEDGNHPVVIANQARYDNHEMVEESLSLMEKEKDLIKKALKKHKNKRKDAAQDLGISERTLYRKIKEYDLE
jgi:DNA-binding NtrC family response regulator